MGWVNIKDKIPDDDQKVWYIFHDRVYLGQFERSDVSFLYHEPDGTRFSNVFFGKHGWLTDDVEYWQPREEGDTKPEPDCAGLAQR